jgi:phosphoserine aminotransferase
LLTFEAAIHPIMRRIYNFSAGPAILPVSVLEQASQAVREIGGSGMSILEVSHRGKIYDPIHAEAQANVLKVLGLSPTITPFVCWAAAPRSSSPCFR